MRGPNLWPARAVPRAKARADLLPAGSAPAPSTPVASRSLVATVSSPPPRRPTRSRRLQPGDLLMAKLEPAPKKHNAPAFDETNDEEASSVVEESDATSDT
eukprot:86260-Pyramimonas_sp.AAC.1